MHWIGLLGMPRRIYTYSEQLGLDGLNLLASAGGFVQAVAILFLLANIIRSLRHGEKAGPPVEHNFNRIPTIHSREPLWIEAAQVEAAARGPEEPHIHMPGPSYWPIFTALGVTMTFALFLAPPWWAPLIGVGWVAVGIVNWAYETA
jgi:cytochrome c oxidase subunit 1